MNSEWVKNAAVCLCADLCRPSTLTPAITTWRKRGRVLHRRCRRHLQVTSYWCQLAIASRQQEVRSRLRRQYHNASLAWSRASWSQPREAGTQSAHGAYIDCRYTCVIIYTKLLALRTRLHVEDAVGNADLSTLTVLLIHILLDKCCCFVDVFWYILWYKCGHVLIWLSLQVHKLWKSGPVNKTSYFNTDCKMPNFRSKGTLENPATCDAGVGWLVLMNCFAAVVALLKCLVWCKVDTVTCFTLCEDRDLNVENFAGCGIFGMCNIGLVREYWTENSTMYAPDYQCRFSLSKDLIVL